MVKGCFICGRDHRVSDIHRSDEVTEAVRRLKEMELKAFITVEDLDLVVNMCVRDNIEE